MSLTQRFIEKITSRYTQNPDSNIGKLIKVITDEVQELHDTNNMIIEYQDIDKAEGKVLDRFGKDIGQERKGMDDMSYRFMIKTKDKANFSNGDIETINEMMTNLLGESYLGLSEAWVSSKYNNEPAAIVLFYDTDIFTPVLLFDGSGKYDGEFLFSGMKEGVFASEALNNIKLAIRRIVKKGIKIYFAIPQKFSYSQAKKYIHAMRVRSLYRVDQQKEYTLSQKVKSNMRATKALTFDGSASFNGIHSYDGERDHTAYGGHLRVIRNGEIAEEVMIHES